MIIYLDISPVNNIIQPIALYNNIDERRSIILFSKYYKNEDKWGFDKVFDNMDLENIYYVFSPSITPLPPETSIFKTNVEGNSTNSIYNILGIFDINGIVENIGNSDLDVIFCAYNRKLEYTIPLNIFIDKKDDKFSMFVTKNSDAFEFPDSNIVDANFQIRQIFVMEKYPENFIKSRLNMCIPALKNKNDTTMSIEECLNSLDVFNHNINRLWDFHINETKYSKKKDNNNNTVNIIVISITSIISIVLIFFIYKKIRKRKI